MFNTLGNLRVNTRAGIIIPDFERGRTLQLTGTAETLWDQDDLADRTGGTHRFLSFHIAQWLELPIYQPGAYAKTDELVALAEVAAKYKGIYISHVRNEGDHEMEAVMSGNS